MYPPTNSPRERERTLRREPTFLPEEERGTLRRELFLLPEVYERILCAESLPLSLRFVKDLGITLRESSSSLLFFPVSLLVLLSGAFCAGFKAGLCAVHIPGCYSRFTVGGQFLLHFLSVLHLLVRFVLPPRGLHWGSGQE